MQQINLDEKRRIVDEICGSWADDDSLNPIFDEIECDRRNSTLRDVNFDAASICTHKQ